MSDIPDFYNLVARDHGAPDGWRWHTLLAVDAPAGTAVAGIPQARLVLMQGAITEMVGGVAYVADPASRRDFIFTFAEIEQKRLRWEAEHGRCARCGEYPPSLCVPPCTRCAHKQQE